MKKIFSLKTFQYVFLAIILFMVGIISPKLIDRFNSSANSTGNSELVGYDGGRYIRFVYIGSSTCLWCGKETNGIVKDLKSYFNELSHELGYKFTSTGISNDHISLKGVEFLSESGDYDEIIAGGNYYNLGSYYYIWEKFPYKPSTPQVLITITNYKIESAGTGSISNINRDEILLKRFDGYYEISEFHNIIDTLTTSIAEKILFNETEEL